MTDKLLSAEELERGRAVIADAQSRGYDHVEIEADFVLKLLNSIEAAPANDSSPPPDVKGLVERLENEAQLNEQDFALFADNYAALLREAASALSAMARERDGAREIALTLAHNAGSFASKVKAAMRPLWSLNSELILMTAAARLAGGSELSQISERLDASLKALLDTIEALKIERAEPSKAEAELSSLKREVLEKLEPFAALTSNSTMQLGTETWPALASLHERLSKEEKSNG